MQPRSLFTASRGKGIQPRSLEVFEDLGIVDRLVAAGGAYPPQRVHRADGSFEDSPFQEISEPTPREPYRIPLDAAAGHDGGDPARTLGRARPPSTLRAGAGRLPQEVDGVTTIVNGAAVRARYLVGADGGRSLVRHTLGVGFPGKTLEVRAVVADLRLDGLDRDAWHRWNDGTPESMSLCPLMGTDLFQLQGRIPLEADIDLSVEGLAAMIAARTRRADIKVRSVSWASAYSMNARLADRYQIGRVFLAGDAAHIHPPTGGQGLNTSVQDTYNLGWKLAAVLGGAPAALLETYEEERRPIAAGMLGLRPSSCRRAAAAAATGAAATPSSSISAIPSRAWRWAARRQRARPTRRCAAPPASRRGCSACSRARTGPAGLRGARSRVRRVPACASIASAPAATSSTTQGHVRDVLRARAGRLRAGAPRRLHRRRRLGADAGSLEPTRVGRSHRELSADGSVIGALAGHLAANIERGFAVDEPFASGRMIGGEEASGASRRTILLGTLLA
jgi:2-polyprenyl-6-methoxyphenol hydroxylase-like FAD-dependent oxidoreductase